MELKMEVYSPALELLGILEVQNAVLWEDYAFKAGSFSVESLLTEESKALLIPDNLVWIEGETAGMVEYLEESVDEDGAHIKAGGRLLSGILDRRILWGTYSMRGVPAVLMKNLVEDCIINPTRGDPDARKIPGIVFSGDIPETGASIRKQKTGDSLLEALTEIGEANQVAFGIRFNAQIPQMEFWARPGIDRTVNQTAVEPVFYSTELDDVLESEYSYDSSEYRNFALVGGEQTDGGLVYETVQEASLPQGMALREMYVDARDLQSDADPDASLTDEEYSEVLKTRGGEKLAENQLVQSFNATVRTMGQTYVYGVDFFLGDTITVVDERLGVTVDAVVQGVERAVTRDGESLSLVLGYAQPTVYEILKRKAGK